MGKVSYGRERDAILEEKENSLVARNALMGCEVDAFGDAWAADASSAWDEGLYGFMLVCLRE